MENLLNGKEVRTEKFEKMIRERMSEQELKS